MQTILARLNTKWLLVWVLFAGIFAMALRPAADADMWWHLRSGQYILETGAIPRTDPFSHTRLGQPWVDQSWLAQIGLYAVYQGLGFGGLALLLAGLVMATFALVFWHCPGHLYVRVGAVLLAALASAVFWSVRPQIASLALTALVAALVHRWRRRGQGRVLWALPPLFALWANLHAAWMAGLLLLLCYLAGDALAALLAPSPGAARLRREQVRTLAAPLVASAAAVSLNPQGPAMLLYPFQTVSMEVLQEFIQEWASPDFHRLSFHPFIWLLLACLWAVAWSRREKDPGDLAVLSLFAALALMAGRNVALFAVVAAPVLSEHGSDALKSLLPPPTRAATVPAWQGLLNGSLALVVATAVAARAWAGPLNPAAVAEEHRRHFPVQAASAILEARPPGKLFNTYNWGGYLLWRLYPAYRVYVDGRTDLYDDTFLQRYQQVAWARPGWETVLDEAGVGFALVESKSPLDLWLEESDDWQETYRDHLAAIWVRQPAAPPEEGKIP